MLASRPDVFPPELVQEMSKLRQDVDPLPFDEIRQTIEEELGSGYLDHFRQIDEIPIASASIAQVHRGVTLDGKSVVLKVQKPRARKQIEGDLALVDIFAEALSSQFGLKGLDPEGIARELHHWLERELNFSFERNSMDRVRASFTDDPSVVIPRTRPELCSDRLLVMDYLDGTTIASSDLDPVEGKRVAEECSRVLFTMIFRHGFFHADPHPSNLLLLENGQIAWVDFGSMGFLTRELRLILVRMLRALVKREYPEFARLVLRLAPSSENIDRFTFTEELATRIDPYLGLELHEIRLPDLLQSLLGMARDHRMEFSPGFIGMTRCLILMEGLAREIDPKFEISGVIEPLLRELVEEEIGPDRLLRLAGERFLDGISVAAEYPEQFGEALRRVARGRVRVETRLEGIDHLGKRIERSSGMIVQALVVSALLISSSLVMRVEVGPMLWGVPAIGLIGYLFAGIIGIGILWGLMRGLRR